MPAPDSDMGSLQKGAGRVGLEKTTTRFRVRATQVPTLRSHHRQDKSQPLIWPGVRLCRKAVMPSRASSELNSSADFRIVQARSESSAFGFRARSKPAALQPRPHFGPPVYAQV